MTKLIGTGVISKKDSRTSADGKFTNYTYEVTLSASKANSQGVIPTTTIRLSANKDMGGSIGSGIKFEAELMPYNKKDGSGSSYFYKALTIAEVEVQKADNTPVSLEDELDDEIPF